MLAAAVAHEEVHVGQGQGRRVAQLIVPAHLGIADNDFTLRQQPAGEPLAGGLGIEPEAGNIDGAPLIPSNVQMRLVEEKGMKAQGAERKRVPRQGAGHRGQRQGYATLAVIELQIGQREVGSQALPARIDAADADALADTARYSLRDQLRMILDLRQDPEAQRQHHHCKTEVDEQGRETEKAQPAAHQAASLRRDAELGQGEKSSASNATARFSACSDCAIRGQDPKPDKPEPSKVSPAGKSPYPTNKGDASPLSSRRTSFGA